MAIDTRLKLVEIMLQERLFEAAQQECAKLLRDKALVVIEGAERLMAGQQVRIVRREQAAGVAAQQPQLGAGFATVWSWVAELGERRFDLCDGLPEPVARQVGIRAGSFFFGPLWLLFWPPCTFFGHPFQGPA